MSVEELLIIHFVVADAYFSDFIKKDNELRGIKDVSLFLSALNEPKQTFDYKDLYPGPLAKAASYMRSIAIDHPFHMMATNVQQ